MPPRIAGLLRISQWNVIIFGGMMPPLRVGDKAPDFELPAVTGEQKHTFKLSDFRGKKNVLLAFHVLNWTPV
jgi:hypothetical protein